MNNHGISPMVASDMGTFEEGIQAFQSSEPPYARGGGTPATKYLQKESLAYLAMSRVTEGALAPSITITPNGQAANHALFRALWGGNLVSSKHLFGTTKVDLTHTFARIGRNEIAWVDPCDTQAFIDNTTDMTTAWYLEAISNPAGRVADLEKLSKAAKEHGVLLVLDITLAAGMPNFNGFEYADVLTVSMNKQAGGGQNINMGGAVIVRNDFPWEGHIPKFSELQFYFANASGILQPPSNPLGSLVTKIGLHEGVNSIPPAMALSIAESLPHLKGNVEKMCQNARMLAELLDNHPNVERVQLAGYRTDKENDERMRRYFGPNHFVLLADIKGGFEATRKFIDTREIFHAVALGQQVTAISNPASSTHRQYSKTDLNAMGFSEGTIRISVGCEPPEELHQRMVRALSL